MSLGRAIGAGLIGLMPFSAAATEAQSCATLDKRMRVASGPYARQTVLYLSCLARVKQEYGRNHGPYAIQRCSSARTKVLGGIAKADKLKVAGILNDMEDKFVWATWCSSALGSPLPQGVRTRAGWPQHRARN